MRGSDTIYTFPAALRNNRSISKPAFYSATVSIVKSRVNGTRSEHLRGYSCEGAISQSGVPTLRLHRASAPALRRASAPIRSMMAALHQPRIASSSTRCSLKGCIMLQKGRPRARRLGGIARQAQATGGGAARREHGGCQDDCTVLRGK